MTVELYTLDGKVSKSGGVRCDLWQCDVSVTYATFTLHLAGTNKGSRACMRASISRYHVTADSMRDCLRNTGNEVCKSNFFYPKRCF